MNIIDLKLPEFCNILKNSDINLNIEEFAKYAKQCELYYGSPQKEKEWLKTYQDLEKQWYESLENNNPDYSVYDNWYYLSETWACWKIYSRQYIKLCGKLPIKDWNIKSGVDLGNGLGLSTIALKEMFDCDFYGTNIKDSMQWKINQFLGNTVEKNILLKKTDLVFASEFFEHLYDPISYLLFVIDNCDPKYFIIANAFSAKSVGHFDMYANDITNKKMGRKFNNVLRSKGYESVKTKFWNNRPNVWKKII
jgi:hypothetical protein